MSIEKRLSKQFRYELSAAFSHTTLTGSAGESLQPYFSGIGQHYWGQCVWQPGKTTVAISGQLLTPNFFSNANPYIQVGVQNLSVQLNRQLGQKLSLEADGTLIQLANKLQQGQVVLAGLAANCQVEKGTMIRIGGKHQQSAFTSKVVLADTSSVAQRVSTLNVDMSSQLSKKVRIGFQTALLHLNNLRLANSRASFQQTYGASVRIRASAVAEFSTSLQSEYITNAELVLGPRVPPGRLYRANFTGNFIVRRVVIVPQCTFRHGEQGYRTLNGQLKLSYVFSKYIKGHVLYLHQFLTGPYEQYNYMNEQVGVGVVGWL